MVQAGFGAGVDAVNLEVIIDLLVIVLTTVEAQSMLIYLPRYARAALTQRGSASVIEHFTAVHGDIDTANVLREHVGGISHPSKPAPQSAILGILQRHCLLLAALQLELPPPMPESSYKVAAIRPFRHMLWHR